MKNNGRELENLKSRERKRKRKGMVGKLQLTNGRLFIFVLQFHVSLFYVMNLDVIFVSN